MGSGRVVAVAAGTLVLLPAAARIGLRRYARQVRQRRHDAARDVLQRVPAEEVWLTTGRPHPLHGYWLPAPGAAASAPALLLQHGFASQASDLLPLAPALHDAGFHLLFLDARGSGRSRHDGGRVTPPMYADDVEIAIDWLIDRPEVHGIGTIGHSMGGGAVVTAASRRPEVGAVVTVAAVADPTIASVGYWPAWLTRVMLPVFRRRAEREAGETEPVSRPGEPPRFPRHHAASLTVPLLVIHGAADRFVPVAHAHALVAAAPGATLDVVPGARHASLEGFAPAMERAIAFLHNALAEPSGAVGVAR